MLLVIAVMRGDIGSSHSGTKIGSIWVAGYMSRGWNLLKPFRWGSGIVFVRTGNLSKLIQEKHKGNPGCLSLFLMTWLAWNVIPDLGKSQHLWLSSFMLCSRRLRHRICTLELEFLEFLQQSRNHQHFRCRYFGATKIKSPKSGTQKFTLFVRHLFSTCWKSTRNVAQDSLQILRLMCRIASTVSWQSCKTHVSYKCGGSCHELGYWQTITRDL